MKKTLIIALLLGVVGGAVLADEPHPVVMAKLHARADTAEYTARGWGVLGGATSFLFSPILGGGATLAVAYFGTPPVRLPAERLAYALETFDPAQVALYDLAYREEAIEPMQMVRGRKALFGAAIGTGAFVLVVGGVLLIDLLSYR